MYSMIKAGAMHGLESYVAGVETDVSKGLPIFEMVGLLGGEVREAKERIRVALKNSGMEIPPSRITVNIGPAGVPKTGTGFDLPVAVGILVSCAMIPAEYTKDMIFLGELGLNGEVREVKGVLPILLAARQEGIRRCMIPLKNLKEGRLVKEIETVGVSSLAEALHYLLLSEEDRDSFRKVQRETEREEEKKEDGKREAVLDFAQIAGQERAKRAAMTAAAGFHNFLMTGPPGAGKTMTARAMLGILPPLSYEEQMEQTVLHSILGKMEEGKLIQERPFVAPHHTVTAAALTGGGKVPMPGMITMAHRGILFLDELTEFQRSTLDLLRQPLEEKKVHLARSTGIYTYPADFMLVAAMNPCPCGYYPDRNRCKCSEWERKRYQSRISGPFLDRIDLCVEVEAVKIESLMGKEQEKNRMDSETMRKMVWEARQRQQKRYKGTGIDYNGRLSPSEIRKFCPLGWEQEDYLIKLGKAFQLSARTFHRLIRVARTLADLDGKEKISSRHLNEAVCSRSTQWIASANRE